MNIEFGNNYVVVKREDIDKCVVPKWYKNDGIYYSEDDRFNIIKATDRLHAGDWELYDALTKSCYYKPTLKECKCLAETLSH